MNKYTLSYDDLRKNVGLPREAMREAVADGYKVKCANLVGPTEDMQIFNGSCGRHMWSDYGITECVDGIMRGLR